MADQITLLLLGLGSGSMIALSALGLVLMYRSSGVVNFATGGIGMVSSYVLWDFTRNAGWSVVPAGAVAIVLAAVLGVVTYVLVMVLPRESSTLTRVIGTLAVLIICEAAVQLHYGTDPVTVKEFLPSGAATLGGGIEIPYSRIVLVLTAVILASALGLAYARSTFGVATTALSERPRTLAALGWRVNVLGAVNWAVGGALAGLAGVLLVPITGASIGSGHIQTVTVLAAALIGGLRSFPLTLVAGLLIGMLQSLFGIHDLGIPGLAEAVPFVAIIAVIAIRGRSLPLRSFVGERLPHVGSGQIGIGRLVAAAVVVVVLIGGVFDDDATIALTTTMLAAITLLSLTVLLGYAGQMSLAQVTLSAVGGLIAAKLAGEAGLPFVPVLILAMLGTVPVGLIVGLPSARTRGVSLAIATLGLAVAIQALVFTNDSLSGGPEGITISEDGSFTIFGAGFDSFLHVDRFAYLVLGFVLVIAVLVANLRRGATGRRMVAVRDNERAAAGLGVNVVATKLWAFAIASAIAAIGGTLVAFSAPVALFGDITVLSNINSVAYSVVGGAGSVLGAIAGSTLQTEGIGSAGLDALVGVGPTTMAFVGGVLLLLTIITAPDGIATATATALSTVRKRLPRVELPVRRRGRDVTEPAAEVEPQRVRASALRLDSIAVTYGAVRAVDGVSLHVEPGEVLGVVGANGAGKTTLIDAITGFAPATGTIELGDAHLTSAPAYVRARAGVARSWQSLELIEDLTVRENLRTATDGGPWWTVLVDLVRPNRSTAPVGMRRAISALGLQEHLDAMPGQLSTGQRKLVALARAISSEPSVLLLDEPCSGLDQHEREEVGKVVRALAAEWGMGVVLVEHDVHLVRRVTDRIVALDFGKVICEGAPETVLTDPAVMTAFLGDAPGAPEREKVIG